MKGSHIDQAVTRREHDETLKAKRTQLVDPFGGIVTDGITEQHIVIVKNDRCR